MRHSQKEKLPKLHEAQSYQETIQILGARKAPAVYRQLVDMAWKIKGDTSGQLRQNMLREAEINLSNDEKHQMSEALHTEVSTEGDARKTGQTAQADGRTLDANAPPGEGSHDGSEPAQTQKGLSQLSSSISEAIDQVADMGSVDPMNTAVIDYLDDGMSKVEAHNAAAKDTAMMEAVFNKKFKDTMLPILKGIQKTFNAYAEAIKASDAKIETSKNTSSGLSEAIQSTVIPIEKVQTSRFDEKSIEETRNEISQKYLSENSVYN